MIGQTGKTRWGQISMAATSEAGQIDISSRELDCELGRGLIARWVQRRPRAGAPCPDVARADLVTRVLAARGVSDSSFLDPKLSWMHDPSLIPDLDRAAARLLTAMKLRESIVIYGDYDADGMTSTAILFHTIRELEPAAEVFTYVPHRIDEGYGLSASALEALCAPNGARPSGQPAAKVIVSVDCGVTALEPAKVAVRHGVDLIITDHHNPPATMAELPACFAVVHPRRPDSTYPFGDLCGAGVAFKLAWRMMTLHFGSPRLPAPLRELMFELLSFAALGSIADVVPLLDENRAIARFGLQRMKTSRFIGLRALVKASRLDGEKVSVTDVGFKLAPRLNASGRMAHAEQAVEMLTVAGPQRAAEIAEQLEELNTERRATERKITDVATAQVVQRGMDRPECAAIVLADANWHVGVVGIVCSRLVEKFCKPVILLGQKEGVWHGSGRSLEGVSLYRAIAKASHLTERFGGHDMAAGLAVLPEKLALFTEAFQHAVAEELRPEMMVRTLAIDTEVRTEELSVAAVSLLMQLDPCGQGNPAPRMLLRGAELYGAPRPVGKSGEHVKVSMRVRERAGVTRYLSLAAWGWADRCADLSPGSAYDLVLKAEISMWSGKPTVELTLEDLAPSAPS